MKRDYTDTMKAAFREEARELLGEMEASLLELEDNPADQELIDRVFRSLHTIKGSGGMFGFEEIADFVHEVETIFDLVRNGGLPVTKELIDLTLMARDQSLKMLEVREEDKPDVGARNGEIISLLKKLSKTGTTEAAASPKEGPRPAPSVRMMTYRLRFRPSADIFLHGTNPVLLLKELQELGRCRILAHTGDIPYLDEINPEHCYTYWDIILTTDRGLNAIKDIFIFVEDDSKIEIEVLAEGDEFDENTVNKKLGDILIDRGDITRERLQSVLGEQEPIGKMLVEEGLVGTDEVESALVEQQYIKEVEEERRKAEKASSIRVRSDKLDGLVDLVGELVTVQARLSQTAGKLDNPELVSISEEVERLTSELRETAMDMRMVPIGTTFSKFQRLVRDLSRQLGKEVQLTTEGAETELDKSVIDNLDDPLIHLIRNCIDHGIETPEERERRNKPRTGRIHLRSTHSGASVLIQIVDDGAGLDTERILDAAKNKGIINAESELSEKEIFHLIFAPGFSTAEKVTGVSGRGVGMDVVKRTIDSLGGSIEIESERGKGTTITLKIPLTLAIIEGLLVRLADDHYIFPLSAVEKCVELSHDDVALSHERHLADVGGNLLPYVNLRETFFIEGKPPDIENIVVTLSNGQRVGFLIDEVIGQMQTVIKTLGGIYKNVEGISGTTILGDGTVALILDTIKLTREAELIDKEGNNGK